MHPYLHDIDTNAEGTLSTDQLQKLSKITTYRSLVGWMLVLCFGFLGSMTSIPLAVGEFEPPLSYIMILMVLLYALGFFYGVKIVAEQKKNKKLIHSPSVHKVEGAPTKVNAAVAIPNIPTAAGGMMLIKHLKAGIVKLEGKKYGSLPGIYTVIEDGELAEFHVVDFAFAGVDGVIVNYL